MEPYVGEIRIFSYNVIPRGWLPCNGQTLPIAQNQALFALLGTRFGGNGQTNFQLPDLRGAAMVCENLQTGAYLVGQFGGTETVALTSTTIPAHIHGLQAQTALGGFILNNAPPTEILAEPTLTVSNDKVGLYYNNPTPNQLVPLDPTTLDAAGAGAPHNNMPPYLVLNICIASQGYFPPRN